MTIKIDQNIDWGKKSSIFDEIQELAQGKNLSEKSEAQTRFDIIDRIIKEVLDWKYGQIHVEPFSDGPKNGFIDYTLTSGDTKIVIEAKKIGASFPSPTKQRKIKLSSSLIKGNGIGDAIEQAIIYSRQQVAAITVVTNGICWCIFLTSGKANPKNPGEAFLLFPFESNSDAKFLYELISNYSVAQHGVSMLTQGGGDVTPDNRLINIVADSDTRVDRNNVADFINPALEEALHSEAVIGDLRLLKDCYVKTVDRSKFDKTLNMYLTDIKPRIFTPAPRIKPGKAHDHLENMIEFPGKAIVRPITLIIAPVGVGKSTYLKHFELIEGREILEKRRAHWIYIDFYAMGRTGNVRDFIYQNLKNYLLDDKKALKTDFEAAIMPAYKDEIEGLIKGPFALIKDKEKIDEIITKHIQNDFDKVEPYVDKIFKYLSQQGLCILVLDNIDLYENDELEGLVLSEGSALSKRLQCKTIISIRDTTFARHKDDAWLDPFHLSKLWLDPPPFKEVISRRFSVSKKILENESAQIPFGPHGMTLNVPNLADFFDIVQHSILDGAQGDFIEVMSDLNIRKGIEFVTNFLTSGHIHADKALAQYIERKNKSYTFPFHEIFKGSILGQRKYYKEDHSYCLNLFDSRLNSKKLRLLRLIVLSYLYENAKFESTARVEVRKCIEIFSHLGANSDQLFSVISDLIKFDLVRSADAKEIGIDSVIFITKIGGYYFQNLIFRMVYIETCMYDTHIDEDETNVWRKLVPITGAIESEINIPRRMEMRKERLELFLNSLINLEDEVIKSLDQENVLRLTPKLKEIKSKAMMEVDNAIYKSRKYFA